MDNQVISKIQPIDSKILTPSGYVVISNLKVDDIICNPNGKTSKIESISEERNKPTYKIIFSNHSETLCCEDHLIPTKCVWERAEKVNYKFRNINEIKSKIVCGANKRINYTTPIIKPIELNKNNLVLDSYAFGCLLGDGSFRHALSYSCSDQFIIDTIKPLLNDIGMDIEKSPDKDYAYTIIGIDRIRNFNPIIQIDENNNEKVFNGVDDLPLEFCKWTVYKAISSQNKYKGFYWKFNDKITSSSLLNYLRDNDLWMKLSVDKHIPDDYKYSCIEDRIKLLQGLMDTDGTVDYSNTGKNGKYFEFTTISPKLKEDFKWLVESLGGTVTIAERYTKYTHKGEKRTGQLSYRIIIKLPNEINPFRLPRKADVVKPRIKYPPLRFITNIEYVGEKPARCITIDDPENLWITNDCVVI